MASPYIGEIRMVGHNFATVGWLFCDGSLLPISQYEPLFVLIGTTYGGDGVNTFALPDLRGRVPMHQSNTVVMGQQSGSESVTLTVGQVPSHTHTMRASTAQGTATVPSNSLALAVNSQGAASIYLSPVDANLVALSPQSTGTTGGPAPHENRQPYQAINFIIAFEGIFPSQG